MQKLSFEPCIPTRGTKIPAGPDWLHEIKHDGYRLIVQREGKRVRLLTRNRYERSPHWLKVKNPKHPSVKRIEDARW